MRGTHGVDRRGRGGSFDRGAPLQYRTRSPAMAIDFRPRDFLQPLALARYRLLLERAQWWDDERQAAYQTRRLREIASHAARQVPYYREAFAAHGLDPDAIDGPAALDRLPIVTKRAVLERSPHLMAAGRARFRPQVVTSTGTTGPAIQVLVDRATNPLEFAFYWRHWGWFGYRLGDRFAQLAWSAFTGPRAGQAAIAERGTGRLLLNARALSEARARAWAEAMLRHRARFLKGHPSALLHFALFVRALRLDVPPLGAVFTTGEVLEPGARRLIQDVFATRVADAYGSMERVVAACECPAGRMHINTDYGLWQTEDGGHDPLSARPLRRIIGTGLYNRSMPLLRFDMGDLVEAGEGGPCPCGRTFPTVGRLHGRSVDAVCTPDGRVITAAAIVFNAVTGVLRGQLVQEDLHRLRARVLPTPAFGLVEAARLVEEIRGMVGPAMTVEIEYASSPDDFGPPGMKHRAVVSSVTRAAVAEGRAVP